MKLSCTLVVALLMTFALGFALCDFPAPVYEVNLDAAPADRYTAIVADILKRHGWADSYGKIIDLLNGILPLKTWREIDEDVLVAAKGYFPAEYLAETAGFYQAAVKLGFGDNCTEGQIAFMQLYYELNNFCTSIVAQHTNGTIFHARNLDYSLSGLENITATVHFKRAGKVIYSATQYVGYFGILTGMRPGGWAVSVNQRFTVEVPFVPTIEAILAGAQSVGFALRAALEKYATYKEAFPAVSEGIFLNSPVYLIMSGANDGEGAILTHNRNGTDESHHSGIWPINPSNGTWYRLETNFDHWSPITDGRRGAANKAMEKVGQKNADLDHLFEVLSTPPVLARDTTYTALMSASLGIYSSTVRTHEKTYQPDNVWTRNLWRAVIDKWLAGNGKAPLKSRTTFY